MCHTPGPWICAETDEGHEIRMGEAVASPYSYESQCVINYEHCIFPEDGKQYEEAEANARLIASSPDLLKACEKALAFVDAWPSGERATNLYNCLINAINKAKEGGP